MDRQKIKYNNFILRLWVDPVVSQIISTGILGLVAFIYSFIGSYLKDVPLKQILIDTLTFKIELYMILIFIVLIIGTLFIIYKWRKRKRDFLGRFNTEQVIGEFTFRELYNALLTNTLQLPPSLGQGKESLLVLFIMYQRQLNIGVPWDRPGDQGSFLYNTFGPALMTYGLTEKAPSNNKADALGLDIIQTSPLGYKFYAQLERYRLYKDLAMQDDITKTS